METCSEEITRGGQLDACGKPAVGERIDTNDPHWYPVCERHFRGTKPWRYPVTTPIRIDPGRTPK